MPLEKLRPSFTFTEDRLAELRAVVPEAFADGRINWDALREALGEHLEDEEQEHFGLSWPGKREARRRATAPSRKTAIPQPGLGLKEDTTHHTFIEGENLEALKLLQKSCAGRVKLVYIDPPYNTGKDFLYPDDYSEDLDSFLQRTGQSDESGRLLTTNSRAGGRFHSNWLTMMYPRLLLARQLLREDGAIFVSIDDNEAHHLRMLMTEVFGDELFVADIAVVNNLKGRNDRRSIATAHEHLLFYSKPQFESLGLQLTEKQISEYGEVDEEGEAFQWRDLRKRGGADTRAARPGLWYPIYADPSTGEIALQPDTRNTVVIWPLKSDGTEGCWRWAPEKVAKNLHIIRASRVENKNKWNVSYRVNLRQNGKMRTAKPKSVWLGSHYSTDAATKAMRDLLPNVDGLTPKAVGFVKDILQQSTEEDDIVLDFFAGSCTTAQAVLELNREDGSNRRFIMVQLAESTPPGSAARQAGYATIADVGRERIRRVIARMQAASATQLDLGQDEDLGFKCYQLARSNFKAWEAYTGEDMAALQLRFDKAETPLVDGWKQEDLLVEVLLLEGFPLDSRVSQLPAFARNVVWRVTSDLVAHSLTVCLDTCLHDATIAALDLLAEDIFICLDSALGDEAKLRLADRCNLRVI